MNYIEKVKSFLIVLSMSCVLVISVPSKPAHACEVPSVFTDVLALWASIEITLLEFFNEAWEFIQKNVSNAQFEMVERFIEFGDHTRDAFGIDFWGSYLPAMKLQTAQLNVANVDQSRNLGSFLDAQSQTEAQRNMKEKEVEAHRRFRVSGMSCQAESIKDTLIETEELATNISKALNVDERYRQGSRVGSISEDGQEAEHSFLYDEANASFCVLGQVGCAAPGPNPMGHILNANFTNGVEMSHDMGVAQNRVLMDRVLSTFSSPVSPVPVPIGVIDSTVAQREILFKRNPLMARKSLLNYVMGEQMGESVAGNVNMEASAARTGSNINPANASFSPSNREIRETMRERILSDAFVGSVLTEPEDLLRRQATMKEQQLRTWIKIKDVNERRLALLAGLLGQELSESTPGAMPATRSKPN